MTLAFGRPLAALVLALTACVGADARDQGVAESPPPRKVPALAPDSARLAVAFDHARDLPRLRSLLVQWQGEIVREQYFGGATPSTRANIKSASKSVMSALVGIAIAQGKIRSVHQTIGELLPAETAGLDSVKRAITVGDLLSMRAGMQSTSFENYGAWVTSRNWVQSALRQPMVAKPGGQMIYSTGSTHLLSAILTRATGMSTHRFAEQYLARPLGITLRPWQTDPQGIYFGGNDMYLLPRDMLRIGTLYLTGGVIRGKQIVPRAWIDSSFVPRTTSPWNGNHYGYGWWTRRAHDYAVRYAWGYGGQFIFIIPELYLVVVATSVADVGREGRATWAIQSLLENEIIPAFLADAPTPADSR